MENENKLCIELNNFYYETYNNYLECIKENKINKDLLFNNLKFSFNVLNDYKKHYDLKITFLNIYDIKFITF